MKKVILLMLSALLVLSLTACGGSVGKMDENKQQTGTDTQTGQGAGLDNSWASNEFEQQIPEPTIEDWEAEREFDGASRWFTQGRCPYEAAKKYAEALRSCGFTLNEETVDYQVELGTNAYTFEADNSSGYHVRLVEESDTVALELTKNGN